MTLFQENELWDIERRSIAYQDGLEAGRLEGSQEGRQEGRMSTLVELILAVLEVRGIEIDEDTRARIHDCDSLPTLQDWARRAREVKLARELFEPM